MRKILLFLMSVLVVASAYAEKKAKIIKITVQPQEAAIYVDNSFIGNGYGEFSRPKKRMKW